MLQNHEMEKERDVIDNVCEQLHQTIVILSHREKNIQNLCLSGWSLSLRPYQTHDIFHMRVFEQKSIISLPHPSKTKKEEKRVSPGTDHLSLPSSSYANAGSGQPFLNSQQPTTGALEQVSGMDDVLHVICFSCGHVVSVLHASRVCILTAIQKRRNLLSHLHLVNFFLLTALVSPSNQAEIPSLCHNFLNHIHQRSAALNGKNLTPRPSLSLSPSLKHSNAFCIQPPVPKLLITPWYRTNKYSMQATPTCSNMIGPDGCQ